MKLRSTLLLLVLAAGLGVFIIKVGLVKPGTLVTALDAAYVAPFDPDSAASIRIFKSGDELSFERQPDGLTWKIVRPVQDRAGRMQMQQLLSMLSAIPHREVITKPSRDELGEFAITNPKMRVRINDASGKRVVEFLVGRDTILPGGIYLGVEGSEDAYVVDAGVRDVVNQPVDAYRDRTLTSLDPMAIDKVVLGNRFGQIELVKRRGEWRIDRPVNARADSGLVSEIVRAAATAQIEEFVAEGSQTFMQMGLADPVGTIALYEEGSDSPHLIQLGATVAQSSASTDRPNGEEASQRELVFARYPQRRAIYQLDAALAKFTALSPNQLRDRTLSRFQMDVVDSFEIYPQNRPGIIFRRTPDAWDMVEPIAGPANSDQVMKALELLRTTRVVAFEADAANNLEVYGLDKPWMRVCVSAYTSENIPEGGSGATPLADVSFGGYSSELQGFYAKLADEPFVVVVSKELTDSLPTSAARWQSLKIFDFDPASITRLSLRLRDRDATYERLRGGIWTLNGQPVESTAPLESAANTLAQLRATLRMDPPSSLPSAPTLAVLFESDGQTRQIEVFASNTDGFFPATIDQGSTFFLISRPDFETIAAPVSILTPSAPGS